MIELRISREGESDVPNTGKVRLYRRESSEIISVLNFLQSLETGHSDGPSSGLWFQRESLHSTPPSMDRLADWLMREVYNEIVAQDKGGFLEGLVAKILKMELGPTDSESIGNFADGHPSGKGRSWGGVALALFSERAEVAMLGHDPRAVPQQGVSPRRMVSLLRAFRSHEGLLDAAVRFRIFGRTGFLSGSPGGSDASGCSYPADEGKIARFIKRFSAEIEAFFAWSDDVSNLAVLLAVRIFNRWINDRLQANRLAFRLLTDSITATYRLTPEELYARLCSSQRTELHIVRPCTVLSACFLMYVTERALPGRLGDWIDAVSLIDKLAFPGVLSLVRPCPVCGHWMVAASGRRTFCSGRCRYKVWAATPTGREKRRKASADFRKRRREETRRATPNVRPGRRKH